MTEIVVIGCGVIGAAIAYELSHFPDLQVTILDRTPPAQGCTSAALGVLMGAISQKTKGKAWEMRAYSLRRYDTLIPELETLGGQTIPYNRQGILWLCTSELEWQQKQKLIGIRQSQGWELQSWSREQLQDHCPHLAAESYWGAIYSPQDRQVNPTLLTQGLVRAAQQRGVVVRSGVEVLGLATTDTRIVVETTMGEWQADGVAIAAGLGSDRLAQLLHSTLKLEPVLGQAIAYQGNLLGNPDFQPVITAADVHIVPAGSGEYWVGATVEFPDNRGILTPSPARLTEAIQAAIAICPQLQHYPITHQWSGLRPRPHNQTAPVITPIPGYQRIWLTTGHYRNGVLLAPATAQQFCQAIIPLLEHNLPTPSLSAGRGKRES